MTDLSKADEELMRLATQDDDAAEVKPETAKPEPKAEAKPEADDTLELGGEEAPEVKTEKEEDKLRTRPWSKRVDILTARNAEKDREIAELRAKLDGKAPAAAAPTLDDVMAKEPKPEDFEFGAADPEYLDARQDWKLDVREAKSQSEKVETDKAKTAETEKEALVAKLSEGAAAVEKAGTEKYDDFEEKITAAADEHGPLSPITSIAVSVSPAGADVAYKLATDSSAREKIEKLAETNIPAAALAFGEMEGEFLPADSDDSDLNLADPLDMLRLNGRMKARLAGKGGSGAERKVSKAPPPPDKRARGSSGQFEVGDDTDDFRAFEQKYRGKP